MKGGPEVIRAAIPTTDPEFMGMGISQFHSENNT
jgi:hypothetical protein